MWLGARGSWVPGDTVEPSRQPDHLCAITVDTGKAVAHYTALSQNHCYSTHGGAPKEDKIPCRRSTKDTSGFASVQAPRMTCVSENER